MAWKRKARILVLLLCFYTISFSFIETTTQRILRPFRVGIVLDSNLTFNDTSLPTDRKVEVVYLRNRRGSFQDFIEEFCAEISTGHYVAIAGFGLTSLLSPVARVITQQLFVPFMVLTDEPLIQTNLQINLYPPPLHQSDAIIALANELGCTSIAIFTTKSGNNPFAIAVRKLAEAHAITFKTVLLSQDRALSTEILYISKEILVMNKSGSCVVVLDCTPSLAALIMETARSFLIADSRFVWVMLRDIINSYNVSEIPNNVLGLRLPFSEYDFLYDGIAAVIKAINDDRLYDVIEGFLHNLSCFTANNSWKNGNLFYRVLKDQVFSGKTGLVQFDDVGNRVNNEIEIVRVFRNTLGQTSWERVGGFDGSDVQLQSNFWIQRTNVTSPNLIRMVTTPEDPVVIVSHNDLSPGEECVLTEPCYSYVTIPGNNTVTPAKRTVKRCCSGLVIDVLNMLKRDLHFETEIYFVEDGKYGAYDPQTKTWDGMINELIQGKADLALTTLTINEGRARFVDYATAFLHGETKIMLSSNEKENSLAVQFNFLLVFDTSLWLTILVLVNIMLVYLWLLDKLSPYGHYKTQTRRRRYIFNIPACMSYVWSNVFKLQLDDLVPRSFSARLVSTVFAFGTLILTTSYTANLAANLVNIQENLPVNDIRDPKFTDSSLGFKFATLGSSSTEMIFTRSSDPEFQRIAQNMKPHSVSSYSEAIEKLDSGELDAFIDDSPFLDLAASKKHDCSLRIVGRAISMHGYSIALRKNSIWTKPITQLFLKYDRRDFFRKLRDKWFTGICVASNNQLNRPQSMELKSFSGLFVVCATAGGICVSLLVAEIIFKSCGRKCIVTYSLNNGGSVRDMFQGIT